MTFRVGQKVVCVDAGKTPGINARGRAADYLKEGRVYTVRWVGECPHEPWRKLGVNIRLAEVNRGGDAERPEWNDFPFRATRFRPIVERSTDISIFTAMLTPKKTRVRA